VNRRRFLQAGAALASAAFLGTAAERPVYAQAPDTVLMLPLRQNTDTWMFRFGPDGTVFSFMPGDRVQRALANGWNVAPAEVADVRVRHCIREAGTSPDVEGIAARCAKRFAHIDFQRYEP
jgi:hypothetical protein